MATHEPLTDEQIQTELGRLTDWRHTDGALATVYKLPSSAKALEFIAAVGEVAEELNHHPDLDWRYNRVIVRFSSHDAGTVVTSMDVEAADRCTLRAAALDAVAQPDKLPG